MPRWGLSGLSLLFLWLPLDLSGLWGLLPDSSGDTCIPDGSNPNGRNQSLCQKSAKD